jgi:hypothetical protein
MKKRKYAYVTLKETPNRGVSVSYHFRSDLREAMEQIGYRDGSYDVQPEGVDSAPSPWKPAKVPVNRLLGVGMLVADLS